MPTEPQSTRPTIIYSHRARPFAAEFGLELTETELVGSRGRSIQRFSLAAIEKITLVFSPRNTAHQCFACVVRARDGRTLKFDSISWKSLIETEKKSADYARFVSILCERAEAGSPQVVLHAGVSPLKHMGMLVMGGVMLAGLAASAIYAFMAKSIPIGLLALMMLGYLGWWMREYLMRNRPTRFTAGTIPATVLPKP